MPVLSSTLLTRIRRYLGAEFHVVSRPDHPMLLYAAYNIAVISKDQQRKLLAIRVLAAREPDNAWLQDLLQKAEGEVAEPATGS